jgi:hypothetical protein
MRPVILAAAQEAEDARNQIQDITRGMLASQGFFSTIVGKTIAYASQAKKTIGYYKDGDCRKRPKLRCWGCGGNHSWMKQGKIVCPRCTDPHVIKAADQRYAEFKDEQAKHGNKPKGKRKRTVKYKDIDEKSKKKMRKMVLAITADKCETTLSVATASLSTASKPGLSVFMLSTLSVPVFNITLPWRISPMDKHIEGCVQLVVGCFPILKFVHWEYTRCHQQLDGVGHELHWSIQVVSNDLFLLALLDAPEEALWGFGHAKRQAKEGIVLEELKTAWTVGVYRVM